jgi:hypothetical protein
MEDMNENVKWQQGGWVFLLGKPEKDGKSYLFVAPIKYLQNLARTKAGGAPGIPANMVTLYPEFYGVGWDNSRNPKLAKISPSLESIKKHIGLSGYNVVLNERKTPFWKVTANEKNLNKILNDHVMWMINDPKLNIPYI